MQFGTIRDSDELKGFIDKDTLLEYVSEEDIFQLVFPYIPGEFEYITSPYRKDKNPGCWFERDIYSNKLVFVDFADHRKIRGVRMGRIDCFDAVMIYYNLSNFFVTLNFIKTKLLKGKKRIKRTPVPRPKTEVGERNRVKILFQPRDFDWRDRGYWQKYGITKQNLIDDSVFPVKKYFMMGTKKGDMEILCSDICYAYSEFENGRRKLYHPNRTKARFISNCSPNDIGGTRHLPPLGKQLIITKSYKDCRVLRNAGLDVIWFQNEGAFPFIHTLKKYTSRYQRTVVVFDNDDAGKRAADLALDYLRNDIGTKAYAVFVPKTDEFVKDPADLIWHRPKEFPKFINNLKS